MTDRAPVAAYELAAAWAAVTAGTFRRSVPQPGADQDLQAFDESGLGAPLAGLPAGRVTLVLAAHGSSGASTVALLIAQAHARAGRPVRLLDLATPGRSGLAAATVTENGLDVTRRWRVGARGRVVVHRLAGPVAAPHLLPPAPPPPGAGAVSVVDTGWPVTQLLAQVPAGADGRLLGCRLDRAQVVVTAQAGRPGLRHLEATLAAIPAGPQVVAVLVGCRRLPRALAGSVGSSVAAAAEQGRLVFLPQRTGLSQAGLSAAPLPRVWGPVGDRLARGDPDPPGPRPARTPLGAVPGADLPAAAPTTPPSSTSDRKDHPS